MMQDRDIVAIENY